jgi:uncharacterized membrane-anchored protein
LASLLAFACASAVGQSVCVADTNAETEAAFAAIPWQEGPCTGDLGGYASIKVPKGYVFTGRDGAPKFLELSQNPPDPTTVGILINVEGADNWVVFFNYADIGHVADNEKGKIDAAAILANLKEGTEASNEERRKRGWEELHITDWIIPPGYEADTNRLAWGVGLNRASGTGSNYDVRLLGRTGVMSVTLSCKPETMMSLVPTLKTLLAGFEYKSGNKYSEWRAGDKVAAYGLTGLITGGAAVAAVKSGLLAKIGVALAKMGKIILIGIAAIGAGVWKMLFGKKTDATVK